MQLPWFMHAHKGENTMVGVFPTPCGTFVRSWKNGEYDVTWYPMGNDFAGGDSRVVQHIGRFPHVDGPEPSEQAVIDFMHSHPKLCMVVSYDPKTNPIRWSQATRDLKVHETEHGTYTLTSADDFSIIRFIPIRGKGEVEVCRLSENIAAAWLNARIADRVTRHALSLAPSAKAA